MGIPARSVLNAPVPTDTSMLSVPNPEFGKRRVPPSRTGFGIFRHYLLSATTYPTAHVTDPSAPAPFSFLSLRLDFSP